MFRKSMQFRGYLLRHRFERHKSTFGSHRLVSSVYSQYATLAKPLTTLLENGCEFDWTSECQEAFVALEQKLSSAPVLAHPLPD